MAQLFRPLRWFWEAVVLAIVVGAVTNRLFGPITDEVWAFLRTHLALLTFGVLRLGGLTLWSYLDKQRQERQKKTQERWIHKEHEYRKCLDEEQRLRQYFALFKPASELSPEDLGFEWCSPGESTNPRYRPLYSTYIRRRAIVYDDLADQDSHDVLDEARIAQELSRGRGFVLLGQPLDGKTRTLYEIVKQLAGYYVVTPMSRPTPPDEAFSLTNGHRVILLLEDLNSYTLGFPDLKEFAAKLSQYADGWAVAATCRDGPELGAVRKAIGTSLRRFYEDIPLKLGLLPLTATEKGQLAQGIGREWNLHDSAHFPTPGSITMEKPLEIMRERFQSLGAAEKDALRGLKLLTTAGILPRTHYRLQAILERIFNRIVHLGDCLDIFAEQSFIRRPAHQDPIQPEPAYLQGAVVYIDGKSPQDDFPLLAEVLETMADAEGLFYLAGTYGLNSNSLQNAIAVYERALQLDPQHSGTWTNKGLTLEELGRHTEALEAHERALQLDPERPQSWHGKGTALMDLGRHTEAPEAHERALQLDPENFATWCNKGLTLAELGRYPEALEAYEQALQLDPEHFETWHDQGNALMQLERHAEALEAYEQTLRLSPEHSLTWHNKGAALFRLGRPAEALEAHERALQLDLENFATWHNKGMALERLGRDGEALEAFERALQLNPEHSSTWEGKGITLMRLRRHAEAREAHERALQLDPLDSTAWHNKGIALAELGRYPEALEAYEQALQLDPQNSATWQAKGSTLTRLGRNLEALEAYERALQLNPQNIAAWANKGVALAELGRDGEALEAYERALQLNPEAPESWHNKGLALARLGRYAEAREAYEQAFQLDPERFAN
jgi:tetratricopeptide (TPR) repeat protein